MSRLLPMVVAALLAPGATAATVCCLAHPTCPTGYAEVQGGCSFLDFRREECVWRSLCCATIFCRKQASTPAPKFCEANGHGFCGGIAAIQCKSGYKCVDDPDDDCDVKNGGADCGGCCVKDASTPAPKFCEANGHGFCGGIAAIQCKSGYKCVDDPDDDCDVKNGDADCGGCCVKDASTPAPKFCEANGHGFCGGIAVIQCKSGYKCVDDPDDDCDVKNGGADCGGCCVKDASTPAPKFCEANGHGFCGGIAAIQCKSGYKCVDDPDDDCDVKNGDADCGGCCVKDASTPAPKFCEANGHGFCGGIAAIQCKSGYKCVDDPDDDCDVKNGGADCGGCCVVSA